MRRLMVDRHQRREPALLDERHADGGADTHTLERRGFLRRKLPQVIVDDQGFAGAKLQHGALAEIGKAVVSQDVPGARRGPVAAYREPVLVRIHVRVGATGDPRYSPSMRVVTSR